MHKYAWPKSGVFQEPSRKGCSHRVLSVGPGWEVCAGRGVPWPPSCISAPISSLSPTGLCRSHFMSLPGLRGGRLEPIDLSRHCIFNLKHFLLLLSENASQGTLVCMLECLSVFLPLIIRSVILCANLACSDTATSERQIGFDKFIKTQFAKSCLDVQESHFYWAVLNTSTWI